MAAKLKSLNAQKAFVEWTTHAQLGGYKRQTMFFAASVQKALPGSVMTVVAAIVTKVSTLLPSNY